MKPSREAIVEYLKALSFDVTLQEPVITASRHVGGDLARQAILLYEHVTDVTREDRKVAGQIAAIRSRMRGVPVKVVVLDAKEDDMRRVEVALGAYRVSVHSYAGFLDALLGGEAICHNIVTAMDFARVHHTYVRQSVVSEGGDELQEDSVQLVRQWLRRSTGGLLVILADAGHGKTSLTRTIAFELARERLDRASAPVPIFVPFGDYRRVTDWSSLVLVRLQEHGVLGVTTAAFDFLLRAGRIVLILDGFDEMSEESGARVAEENLRMIASHLEGRGRVVLTSRSTFFRSSAEISEIIERRVDQALIRTYELKEFDADQRREYLTRTLPTEGMADRVLGIIRGNEALAQLAGSPLVLNMLATAVEEHPGRFTAGRDKASLYALYFKGIFERERKRQGHNLTDDEQFNFLERVADSMFADRTTIYPRQDIAYFVSEALPGQVERLRGRKAEEEALTSKLCDHAAFSAEGTGIRFAHPTFRDYFAARMWAPQLQNGSLSVLSRPSLPDAAAEFLAEMLNMETLSRIARVGLARSSDGQLLRSTMRLLIAFAKSRYPSEIDLRQNVFTVLTGAPLNLNSRDLSGLNFDGVSLVDASCVRANLDGTRFVACDLRNAEFSGALMRMTLFEKCRLEGAVFRDLTQFVSIRIGRADMATTELDVARRQLQALGADVGLPAANPAPREIVVRLLVDQFRKFKPVGRGHWEIERRSDSLLRGLEGKERNLVERNLIPALRTAGYYQERRLGGRSFVKLANTRDPANLLETGELSPTLERLVGAILLDASRVLEL